MTRHHSADFNRQQQAIRSMRDIAAAQAAAAADEPTASAAIPSGFADNAAPVDAQPAQTAVPLDVPEAEVTPAAQPRANAEQRTLVTALWVGTILFSVIPGLLIMLVKSNDDYLSEHAKEALNWSITALIGYVVGSLLSIVFIGMPLLVLLLVAHIVFCAMGAKAGLEGQPFRVPLTWRPLS